MNITILTYGSRGDVQPFLPLSLELMSNGHSVKLAAPSRFKDLVEGYGIQFVPLPGEPEDLSRRLNDSGYNFVKMVREMMSHAVEIGAEMLRKTEEACADGHRAARASRGVPPARTGDDYRRRMGQA
jgi:sterol 3beta-glucosyltransferase